VNGAVGGEGPGFDGRVIAVTGAASGIGEACATHLSAGGARVALVDRDEAGLDRVAGNLSGEAVAVIADVSTADGVQAYVGACVERWGQLDGVHLNAGIAGPIAPFAETDVDQYDAIMAINARGVYLGLRAAIRQMIAQETGGSIVVTASTAGLSGAPSMGLYSASKHAAVGLVKAAAIDHAADRIRVNAICPGEVDTPMLREGVRRAAADDAQMAGMLADMTARIPTGRLALPAEPARAAAWLLSDESSYVTGAVLVVDGGLSIGGYVADRG
jgi:NAD(P)-dependent dehydrogenase (short-subunit alcohol dehydrogenase family)